MIKIQWKSFTGYDLTLEIDDGVQTVTNITPSATPFITQGDDSNDMFQPIRAQSGNIGIVATLAEFEQLVGNYPLQRPVTLKSSLNGASPVVQWRGYIQSAAYSQDWVGGNMEISVPVVSRIGVWEYIRSGVDDGYLSFADIIKRAGNAVGGFEGYIFPTFINPETTLGYKVQMANFTTRDTSFETYNVYETATFDELIEAICKLFGLVCIEYRKNLCFIAPDYNGNYIQFNEENMDQIEYGESPTSPQTYTATTIISTVNRADNNISYLPGKRRVKVTGKVNPYDLTVCSINGDEIPLGDTGMDVHVVSSGYDEYFTKDYLTSQYSFLKTYDGSGYEGHEMSNRNIRFENFERRVDGLSTNLYGCCFVNERQLIEGFRERSGFASEDTGWQQRIQFRLSQTQINNATTQTPLAIITSRNRLNYSYLWQGKYLSINGNVRKSNGEWNSDKWEAWTGYLHLQVIYGLQTLYNGWLRVFEGQFLGGSISTPAGTVTGVARKGFVVQLPDNITEHSDFIKFIISATPITGYYDQGIVEADKYFSIEGFNVTVENAWNMVTPEPNEDDENVAKADTDNGWLEDLDIDIPLTIAVDRSSWKVSDQFGKGIILANNVRDENPHTLYDNKTPEEALKDRLVAHFSDSKKMLEASVVMPPTNNSYGPLQPWQTHSPDAQGSWAVLAQTIDWRDDVITGKFFER